MLLLLGICTYSKIRRKRNEINESKLKMMVYIAVRFNSFIVRILKGYVPKVAPYLVVSDLL